MEVDLSIADKVHEELLRKARLVWDAAARRGKRLPLDDETAAALGHDLKWAACFRTVADSPLSQLHRIKQIENTARKLERLLDSNPEACRMIEQFWPRFLVLLGSSGHPPPLKDPRRDWLPELCEAAREAETHRGGGYNLREKYGPMELFFFEAEKAYVKYTGREAGVGRGLDRTIGGPFVRFVQEASRQFCEGMAVPSSETILTFVYRPKK